MEDDEDWSPSFKRKRNSSSCIIYCSATSGPLTTPASYQSWKTLLDAAVTRKHTTLIDVAKNLQEGEIPDIQYHRECRSIFTLKKSLETLKEKRADSCTNEKKSSKRRITKNSIILDKVCIFCSKVVKKKKGEKETPTQCLEMRAQRTIHNTALRLNDPRILHLVQNHDLIAAEAHYHVTCYKSFTRVRPDKPDKAEEKDEGKDDEDDEDDDYRIKEALSLDKLFHYIRNEVIAKEQVTTLVDLTLKLVQYLREAGLQQILDSTKKHLRRKLENEFGSAVTMFPNDSGRIIFLPLSVSATKLASEIVELKQELMQYRTDSGNSSRLVKNAAFLLRSEAKSFQSPPAWPPLVSQLQGNNFPLPKNLNIFVTTLLDTNDAEENIFTPKQHL
eukprot:gene20769-22792_t